MLESHTTAASHNFYHYNPRVREKAMNLRFSNAKLRKTVASVLVPLVLILNLPIAALAAPQPPMPPSIPKFSQNPKSVRTGSKSLRPIKPRTLPAHPD